MKKEKIESLLKCKIGVCSFESVKDNLIKCRNLQKLPQNAKSIILFLFPYKVKEQPPKNISRYAAVPDYHKICGTQLEIYCDLLKKSFKDNEFQWFIDNSPINEVHAAAYAGLGVIGENGLLISKEYGSFVFIGEIVTDLQIDGENKAGGCINCGKCKDVCPVGLNKQECISAVTQKKGELSEKETLYIKNHGCIWGCDICQEVCPMNIGGKTTENEQFLSGYRDEYLPGESIEGRAYAWRGEKVIKRNYEIKKS